TPALPSRVSQFIRERILTVVFFLLRDVAVDSISCGRTDSERCISFLPGKTSFKILLNPISRILLQIPHQIGNAMCRAQTSQKVYVVRYATDDLRDAVHSSDNSTKVGMQSRTPLYMDKRSSRFCRKHNVVVVVQTEEG